MPPVPIEQVNFYKDKEIVDLIKEIKKEVDFAFYPYEAYMIYSIVKTQTELEGDLAEVGVFQGVTSRNVCEILNKLHDNNFNYYGVDLFEGTTPMKPESSSRTGGSKALEGVDPRDSGIDISAFGNSGIWKKLAGN